MQHVSPSPKGIAWTTAGLLLIAILALAGILISNAVAFSSSSPNLPFQQGNGSQLPSQVYQPIPTPTPVPVIPTPTPVQILSVPSTPTPTTSTDLAQIKAAVTLSNEQWIGSMQCVCDNNLEESKTGSNLQSTLAQVRSLKRSGEYWVVSPYRFIVTSIHQSSPVRATALVTKDESHSVMRGKTVTQHCSGMYQVQYSLVNTANGWRVSFTKVLGSGQTCTNGS